MPCRAANARYLAGLRGRGQAGARPVLLDLVEAEPARQHLTHLKTLGIGYRRAAELADVDPALILDIRLQRRRRIRRETAERILGIKPSLAHGQAVPSWRTWRFLDSLVGEGFTLQDVARKLGRTSIQFKRVGGKVRVRNALMVKRLWQLLMDEDGAVVEIGPKDNADGEETPAREDGA